MNKGTISRKIDLIGGGAARQYQFLMERGLLQEKSNLDLPETNSIFPEKYLVDPVHITNYDLFQEELELVLLFWITAAGKNAKTSARCLQKLMLELEKDNLSPFSLVRQNTQNLSDLMKSCGIGCYRNKAKTFSILTKAELDLKFCSLEHLEGIWGLGRKTARCFLIHSRPNQRYTGLDTHCLKYLRDRGIDAPKSTPSSNKKYRELELKFLEFSDQSGLSSADFDLLVWQIYSGNFPGNQEDLSRNLELLGLS